MDVYPLGIQRQVLLKEVNIPERTIDFCIQELYRKNLITKTTESNQVRYQLIKEISELELKKFLEK